MTKGRKTFSSLHKLYKLCRPSSDRLRTKKFGSCHLFFGKLSLLCPSSAPLLVPPSLGAEYKVGGELSVRGSGRNSSCRMIGDLNTSAHGTGAWNKRLLKQQRKLIKARKVRRPGWQCKVWVKPGREYRSPVRGRRAWAEERTLSLWRL